MPVPQPTDKPEASDLPDPELNPLLNPLLAENLGRWAEVYFTALPENRVQAVSELLRELRNGSAAASVSAPDIQDEKRGENPAAEAAPDSPAMPAESLGTCGACGHDNSAVQRFCGMCGAPLPTSGGRDDARESPWTRPQISLPSFTVAEETEPVSHRYRLYAGVFLAVVVALLLYRAWPNNRKSISGPTDAQSAISGATPVAQPAQPSNSPQPSATATQEASPQEFPAPSQEYPPANSRKKRTAAREASPDVRAAASSAAPATERGGAEDLATAEKYLSGSQGMPRDSREASLWLWKAVGKGNLAATVALSDLYLRGDGVPKNCDQGRLLLDAAARKGGKAAAERLRNLQAFGCE